MANTKVLLLCITAAASVLSVSAKINASDIVQVTELPSTAGLYFQPVSKLQFVQNTWHFIIEMDHGAVFRQLDELYKNVLELMTYMSTEALVKNCSTSAIIKLEIENRIVRRIRQLVKQHNEIDDKVPRLEESMNEPQAKLHRPSYIRKKRGILNFVGSIDKYLFGLMDSTDAHELHMLANTSNAIDSQVKQLTDEMIKLTNYVSHNAAVDSHKSSEICLYLDVKLNLICEQLNEIEDIYDRLDRAVDSAKQNHLNSIVIAPSRLLKEMTEVSGNLAGLSWPVALELQNMHVLIDSLINTHVFRAKDRKLLFILEVPLIVNEIYDLYHTIPLPYCSPTDKCAILLPDSKYLAVSQNRRGYVRYDDVSTCKTIRDTKLCYEPRIIYNTNLAKLCDIRIFMKSDQTIDYDKDCDVRVGRFENELFYAIADYNNWLYVLRENVDLNFVCVPTPNIPAGTLVSPIMLKAGVGVIHATGKDNCKLTTQKSTLTIHTLYNNLKSVVQVPISTLFNISEAIKDIDKLQLASLKTNNDLEHTNLHELTDRLYVLRQRMNNNTRFSGAEIQDETENNWLSDWFNGIKDTWWYVKTGGGLIFGLLVLAIAVLVIKKIVDSCDICSKLCRCCCRKKRHGTLFNMPDRQMYQQSNTLVKRMNNNQQKSLGYTYGEPETIELVDHNLI
jgi:Baculovirus F protein